MCGCSCSTACRACCGRFQVAHDAARVRRCVGRRIYGHQPARRGGGCGCGRWHGMCHRPTPRGITFGELPADLRSMLVHAPGLGWAQMIADLCVCDPCVRRHSGRAGTSYLWMRSRWTRPTAPPRRESLARSFCSSVLYITQPVLCAYNHCHAGQLCRFFFLPPRDRLKFVCVF